MIADRIARETGINRDVIDTIIRTASRRYKTYSIAKRTGGTRQINQPARVVKFMQRWIVDNFIVHLPVHSCVLSYRQGVGIERNARVHAKQNFLLKMDFQDFFPSVRGEDIRRLLQENVDLPAFAGLDEQDLDAIVKIACKNGGLTIGAPSSPSISNAVLYTFDGCVSEECAKRNVVYSRYADDISFSTDESGVLNEIHNFVIGILEQQKSPRLSINHDKTIFTSKKRRRLVTGLILTSDEKVSIGRQKKREIKTLCHLFRRGELSAEDVSYLRGYLSFVRSVEPDFVSSLERKYGLEVLQKIAGATLARRK